MTWHQYQTSRFDAGMKWLVFRVIWLVPVLLTVILFTFLLIHAAPGNPWDSRPGSKVMTGHSISDSTMRYLDRYYGLDKPLWRQFAAYVVGDWDSEGAFVCGLVCGNLGPSYRQYGRAVQDILFLPPEGRPIWESRFWYSVRLAGIALLMAVIVGVPAGGVAALRRNSRLDYLITALSTLAMSIPSFVIGLLLIIILATELHIIRVTPGSWYEADWTAWVVPSFVLGLALAASLARITRASMLEVLRADYVRTARAKGLPERLVVLRHVLRNSLIPIITVLGPGVAELVAGAFIIESMFSFPGLAREYVDAAVARDYPMVLAATLLFAGLVALANLCVDVMYVWIDPRVRAQ